MPRSCRPWRSASAARPVSAPRSTATPDRGGGHAIRTMLRLGYKASAEQFGPNELLDYSILAEQRGFDSVFISDHFQPWRQPTATRRFRWPGWARWARAPRASSWAPACSRPRSAITPRSWPRPSRRWRDVSGAGDPRRGHGRIAQRGAGTRDCPGRNRRSARRGSRKRWP